jgi:molybdopterin synthase catalytic subunit
VAPEPIIGVRVGAHSVLIASFITDVITDVIAAFIVWHVRRHSPNVSWMPCIGDRAPHYDGTVPVPPPDVHNWITLTHHVLDVRVANEWLSRPECGAVVLFNGLVRDHADDTNGVIHIDYEAYGEEVVPRLEALAEQARLRWPDLARIVLWHREGRVLLGESSVVVAVSSPHRGAAFEASRFLIDTLKATVPIWKKEFWDGGSQWASGSQHIVELSDVPATLASDVEVGR